MPGKRKLAYSTIFNPHIPPTGILYLAVTLFRPTLPVPTAFAPSDDSIFLPSPPNAFSPPPETPPIDVAALNETELAALLSGSDLPKTDPTLAPDSVLPSSTPIDQQDSDSDPTLFPDPSFYDSYISAGMCTESDRPDSYVGVWPGTCPYNIAGLDSSVTQRVVYVDASAVGAGGSGTKDDPVGTLGEAIATGCVSTEGCKILLTEGEYPAVGDTSLYYDFSVGDCSALSSRDATALNTCLDLPVALTIEGSG